ncbi:MAG: hypothetical protein KC503_33020 [Myxococcales bacterium]|nr:hypothetical protein [Myxococcales bacterium]
MRRNILCTVLLAALLGAGLTGCGDSETKLFIQPFFGSPIELQVNQEINIDVSLNSTVGERTYVDIQNPVPDQLELTPPQTVTFDPNESNKQVKLYPRQQTVGQVTLVFTLRDTTSTAEFLVTVK